MGTDLIKNKKVKIGIPACFMYPDKKRPVFGPKSLSYIENDMVNYLSRNNCMPILLLDLPDEELKDYLDEMDGFLFQGGSDLAPETYGEEPIENGKWPGDIYRDKFEFKILDYALENKKPIYGICRGFQIINAYFGGTLYQDISIQTDTEIIHRDAENYDRNFHEAEVVEGSYLSNLYKEKNIIINTIHHQGVDELAHDLIPQAYSSEDKVIEALTYKDMDKQYILGVQWHPEFSETLKGQHADPDVLMNDFLNRCRQG